MRTTTDPRLRRPADRPRDLATAVQVERLRQPVRAHVRVHSWSKYRSQLERGGFRINDEGRIKCILFCTPGRSRTRNLTGRNRLLYPVELQGLSHIVPNAIAFSVSTKTRWAIME